MDAALAALCVPNALNIAARARRHGVDRSSLSRRFRKKPSIVTVVVGMVGHNINRNSHIYTMPRNVVPYVGWVSRTSDNYIV